MDLTGFEINRELVLSTGHVTEADNALLAKRVKDGVIAATEFGWRICTNLEMTFARVRLDAECGYSPALLQLLDTARILGCKWLVLEADGPLHDELPKFDW